MKVGRLLGREESVATQRLLLRTARQDDLASLGWLGGALAPDWTLDDLSPHVAAGEAVVMSVRDGGPVGLAVVLLGQPISGAACVPFIAIDPAARFRGLGGEAGLALERLTRERWQARRALAPVPERRGLAVYFWLRLGYRPLTQAEAPWPLVGLNGRVGPGIWMARDFS